MEPRELEEKLTPAARQAIDELLRDYRKELLLVAQDSAARATGEVREISVSDITAGVNRLGGRFPRYPRTFVERLTQLYYRTGILIGVVGILYYVVKHGINFPSLAREPEIVASISGFLLAGIAFLVRNTKMGVRLIRVLAPSPERDSVRFVGEFLARWRDLELAVRNLATRRLGESMATAPFSNLLRQLMLEGVLKEEEEASLRNLLRLRNKVLHEGMPISSQETFAALREVESLLHHLTPTE